MKVAWSHSAVELFRQCPRRYFETRVAKSVKDEFKGPKADWGTAVHKAMERRVRLGVALPSNMSQYEKVAGKLADMQGTLLTEQQLAINEQHEPVEWFAKNVWCRAIIDFCAIHPAGDKAMVLDYKTGKRKEDDGQLALCAAMIFDHYPEVDTVVSGFVWMGERAAFDKVTFKRKYADRLWGLYTPDVDRIEHAMDAGRWPEKPSGLCNGWCPVTQCKHHSKR